MSIVVIQIIIIQRGNTTDVCYIVCVYVKSKIILQYIYTQIDFQVNSVVYITFLSN